MNDTPSSPPAGEPAATRPQDRSAGKRKRIIFLVIALAIIGAFVWAESSRRNATNELEQTRVELEELKKTTTQDSSQETANRVRENVAKLINIPLDPAPTVATISDVEKLKESNEFFNVAQNGDFLILTGNRAILYNLEKNIILDVAPFRVNSPSPSPTGSPTATPRPTAAPTPTEE